MDNEKNNQDFPENQPQEEQKKQEENKEISINPEYKFIFDIVEKTKQEIQKVIIGQDRVIELMLAGLFSGGLILLEGVPGVAKTLLVKLLSRTLSVDFKRIQFTPDLMPSDVVGTTVFNMKTSDFYFRKGPIFSNFILVDEINRAPAKTQAALFEVMEEKQVTVEGELYEMGFPLFIVATQNPIEQEGTYKLPEAQLDRFMFKVIVDYPGLEEEQNILKRFNSDFNQRVIDNVKMTFSVSDLEKCCMLIEKTYIKDELLDYIAKIVESTRHTGDLFLGASPRASLAIMKTAKSLAAMRGRDFVTPDDIQYVAHPVLNHRIILMPEREIEGIGTEDVINEIIKRIEVPR